jgi:hypothetical protein
MQSFMDTDLARSGLVAADLHAVETVDGFTGASRYVIPYYYPNGARHPIMQRERLSNPPPGHGKYTQPERALLVAAGQPPYDATYPYLHPSIPWANLIVTRAVRTWVLAEGEKKAVALLKFCLRPAIGIGGCWNGVYRENEDSIPLLHPVLAAIFQPGDIVEIVLDADMYTNRHVNLAAGTLRRALLLHGVTPVFVRVPMHGGVDTWLLPIDPLMRAAAFDALPRDRCDSGELRENHKLLCHYLDLPLSAKGKLIPNESAVMRVLEKHERYKGKIWVEDTSNTMMETVSTDAARGVTDAFCAAEAMWMQTHIDGMFLPGRVTTGLSALTNNPAHHRNAIHDYVNSLRWDMQPRVEEMFMRGWGAPDNQYTRSVGRAWLLSAMARAFQPGCTVQTMLVLEGAQGIGKSRSLKALGGKWYAESATRMDSKDFILEAHRCWFFDLAELGAYKYADFAFAKALLSTAVDLTRAPYARNAEERPRRFVIVATTNEDEYLRDMTGNRRFWPIPCTKIDMDWIVANRDQLMAEAKVQLDAGEVWWIPDAITSPVQDSRVVTDPWQDMIAALLVQAQQVPAINMRGQDVFFLPLATILSGLGVPASSLHSGHHHRVHAIIKKHFRDWTKARYANPNKPIMVCGTLQDTARGFYKPTHPSTASNVIQISPQP